MQAHDTAMQENMRALRAVQGTTLQAGMAGKLMSAAQQASPTPPCSNDWI